MSWDSSALKPAGYDDWYKGTSVHHSQEESRQHLCNLVEQAYYAGQHNNEDEMVVLIRKAVCYANKYYRPRPVDCEIVLDGKRYTLTEKTDGLPA